jgi:hypothetical protein
LIADQFDQSYPDDSPPAMRLTKPGSAAANRCRMRANAVAFARIEVPPSSSGHSSVGCPSLATA